jgi:hypothetical protein
MLMMLGAPGSRLFEACVLDVSNHGVQVRVSSPLPLDTLVKIDSGNELMLGKVCHCDPSEGAYRVGIQLSAPLPSLMELELLNRALIGEKPARKAVSPASNKV